MPTMQEMYAKSQEAGFIDVFNKLVELEPVKRAEFCVAVLKSLAAMSTNKKGFLTVVCNELMEDGEPIVKVKCSLCNHMMPVPESSKDLVHVCLGCLRKKKE